MAPANIPVDNYSYTNKDFPSIFEELLETVKKLTSKWDPSISNESDPGVILLKLNAIIGDKNNYNIDKNILETFPQTLTQEVSARNIYDQLAYHMPWYQASETEVSLRWVGEDDYSIDNILSVTIPAFTMITNEDGSIVYTLIKDVIFNADTTTTKAPALQGISTQYQVNGDVIITTDNLTSENRLYLGDYAVAENGIFVYSNNGGTKWEQVDNVYTAEANTLCYEFNVDNRTNACYLQFPDDIDNLIGDGITVNYVLTNGETGNISANTLSKFYDESSIYVNDTLSIPLNEEVCVLTNLSASYGGQNPQTISDAYIGYKHTAGTFKTLVTLRDYINAIYNLKYVSNDVVSDRNTDVQSSYDVVIDYGTYDNIERQLDESTNVPVLDAFDLKLYVLKSTENMESISDYDTSFVLADNNDSILETIKQDIDNLKTISHDFKDLLKNKPCLFFNKYPLRIRVIPQYSMTTVQQDSVKINIQKALFKLLNSKELEFGVAPDYSDIYNTIMNADERIKLILIDDLKYTTYAVYIDDNNEIKQVPISDWSNDPFVIWSSQTTAQNATADWNANKPTTAPDRYLYLYADSNHKICAYTYAKATGFSEYSDKISEFRTDVIAKSVAAGKTPLFEKENDFTRLLSQNGTVEKELTTITTNLTLLPYKEPRNADYTSNGTITIAPNTSSDPYELKANESLRFVAPALYDEQVYSNYVIFDSGSVSSSHVYLDFNANSEIKLGENEYLAFFWKEENETDAPYRYKIYTTNTIFKANFGLPTGFKNMGLSIYDSLPDKTSGYIPYGTEDYNTLKSAEANHWLTGKKTIAIRKLNEKELAKQNYYIYAIGPSTDGKTYSITLTYNSNDGDASYVLGENEYFIWAPKDKSMFEVLGTGTRISANISSSKTLTFDLVSAEDIFNLGLDGFINEAITNEYQMKCTEQQIYNFTQGDKVKFTYNGLTSLSTFEINSSAYTTMDNFTVSYVVAGSDETEQSLPDISSLGLSWKALALLNINCDSESAQAFKNDGEFNDTDNKWYVDSFRYFEVPASPNNHKYPAFLYDTADDTALPEHYVISNKSIIRAGGNNIDISYTDIMSGDSIPVDMYFYTINSDFSGTNISTLANSIIQIDWNGISSWSCSDIEFSEPCKILMGIRNNLVDSDNVGADATLTFSDIDPSHYSVTGLNCDSVEDTSTGTTTLTSGITSYYLFEADGNAGGSFSLSISKSDVTGTILIKPIMYLTNSNRFESDYGISLGSIGNGGILDAISSLTNGDKFDYSYDISEDVLIDDPLDPESFFNSNHIFNKYTLPYANLKMSNLNSKDSNIIVSNN